MSTKCCLVFTLLAQYSQLAASANWLSRCFMVNALPPFFGLPGQMSAQFPQPRQSRTSTWIRNVIPSNTLPTAFSCSNWAPFCSSASSTNGRIEAWGQTYAHLLHWIQFSGFHSGTNAATPRFSYLAVPWYQVPSSIPLNADTGSKSPSCALIGRTTSLMNAGSLFSTFASSGKLAHAGSTVSCLYSPPRSTAA